MNPLNQTEIFSRLEGDLSLLNSNLLSLQVEKVNNSLVATVRLLVGSFENQRLLTFVFRYVREYSFFYSSNYSFYNVESYKFTFSEGKVYLSLDPADDTQERNLDDQDYILADEVSGFIEKQN